MKEKQFLSLVIFSSILISSLLVQTFGATQDRRGLRQGRRRRNHGDGVKRNFVKKLIRRRPKEGSLRLVNGENEFEGKLGELELFEPHLSK